MVIMIILQPANRDFGCVRQQTHHQSQQQCSRLTHQQTPQHYHQQTHHYAHHCMPRLAV